MPDPGRFDTSRLKLAASGGASLPVEVLYEVQRRFGFQLLEGYGLVGDLADRLLQPPGPAGQAGLGGASRSAGVEFQLWGPDDTEVAPGEVGEIVIRGENVMKGYWNKPEATAEAMRAGWFHSGDLATRDDDGFYFIVDRKKDMIIRNGMNVYPREVEEVLYTHPAVAEAAVFGVPDALHGEEIACLSP